MSTANLQRSYNTLKNGKTCLEEDVNCMDGDDNEDTPRSSGVMIHVVPEANKTRWNHIEDLDSFFTRMYYYHQKHGFYVITLDETFQLLQFAFVVWLLSFTTHCIRYPILFGDVLPNPNTTKVTISDTTMSREECIDRFGAFTWFALAFSGLFIVLRFVRICYHVTQFWDIKKFYNTALKIEDVDLNNLTWHEVQKKVREVQSEQQMCIHKEQLTELDIYHRILRFKNYTVAMLNKNILPTRIKLPGIGEYCCLSRGMRFNIELVLFRGPWSPFENNWHLREEYKKSNKRQELSRQLSRQIFWLAIANLLLSPFIFLWQFTYTSFNYAALLKKEPTILGSRCWSQYGRLYLRHFNELDHELDARLNRAYEPSDKYISSFSSPVLAVIAKNILFICGGILAVILLLTIYNEHVVQVEHVLTIASAITVIGVAARVFIPDENLIWCPEQLLTTVLAHIHYMPVTWKGLAHTQNVRREFEQFFQLKAVNILTELLSPFVTPFVLLYTFRHRAVDIVDFFRNFTVSVVGVGDVCSFAQMDVRKHGHPDWQIKQSVRNDKTSDFTCKTNQYTQGEHGKTELSLVHFTLTNPDWKMPPEAKQFLQTIRRNALHDLHNLKWGVDAQLNGTVMEQSLLSFGNMGNEYSNIAHSILQSHSFGTPISTIVGQRRSDISSNVDNMQIGQMNNNPIDFEQMLQKNLYDVSTTPKPGVLPNIEEREIEEDGRDSSNINTGIEKNVRRGLSKVEGKLEGATAGLLYSLYGHYPQIIGNHYGITIADMCFSALHLHEIHQTKIRRRSIHLEHNQRQIWQRQNESVNLATPTIAESTPLLAERRL